MILYFKVFLQNVKHNLQIENKFLTIRIPINEIILSLIDEMNHWKYISRYF